MKPAPHRHARQGTPLFRDRAILTLALGQTLVWAMLFYIFPASVLRWELALGWSKADLTLGITIAILASAAAAPLAGRIIDAGHGAVLMSATTALGGLGVLLLSGITELWQFYLLWGVIGMALAGCLYDACFALVVHARGADAKRAIVTITLIAGFAGTISFPLMHVLAEALGWRGATACFGLVAIGIVAPIQLLGARALMGQAAPHRPADGAAESTRAFLRRPQFWLLGLGFGVLALVHGAALNHLLPLLDERGVSAQTAVFAAASIGPMQVAGRLMMVVGETRLSHHQFALLAFGLIGAAMLILLVAGTHPVMIALFAMLFGAAFGMISILRPVIARDVLGQSAFGAKSGALARIFLVGSAGAAYLGSLIWHLGGYGMMLVVLALLAGLGAVLYLLAADRSGASY